MTDKLLHIHERFPGKIRVIDRLAKKDPEFLDLCHDYDDCIRAMRHWASSTDPEAKAKFGEYRTIVHDLEKEVQEILAVKPYEG